MKNTIKGSGTEVGGLFEGLLNGTFIVTLPLVILKLLLPQSIVNANN
jgi:hypothetical protein